MDTQTDIVYIRTGYDFIIYFRSEIVGEKTVDFTACDGFCGNLSRTAQARIVKFYELIEDKWPHKPARNGVTSSVRYAAKCY